MSTSMSYVPVVETNPLRAAVEQEAAAYRERGTPFGDYLAYELDRISQIIGFTGATTGDEHLARFAVHEDEVREQWEARGFENGRETCRCQRGRD